MGVSRHKIWRDLWANNARTLQVILIVAMGAFAVGMIDTVLGVLALWLLASRATHISVRESLSYQ